MTLFDSAKSLVKPHLSPALRQRLKIWFQHGLAPLYARNLPVLATIYGTDKWNIHWYARHYQHHFAPLRRERINLVEIGVGGYADPRAGGESLRMWKRFFPRAHIYGVDLYDKSPLQEPRITIFRGSQDDPAFLHRVAREVGRLDVVIDDGSHRNEHVVATFETLFPLLADGGIYAIEDTQTSYWPAFGGSEDVNCAHTTMNRVKRLLDGLNYEEFLDASYASNSFDRTVTAVHCYHNLVVIYKGVNAEGSYRPPA